MRCCRPAKKAGDLAQDLLFFDPGCAENAKSIWRYKLLLEHEKCGLTTVLQYQKEDIYLAKGTKSFAYPTQRILCRHSRREYKENKTAEYIQNQPKVDKRQDQVTMGAFTNLFMGEWGRQAVTKAIDWDVGLIYVGSNHIIIEIMGGRETVRSGRGGKMTTQEAREKIAVHAGRTEKFVNGYQYALKFGPCDGKELQHKFDEILICLKTLYEASDLFQLDQELLTELNEILYGSILYLNRQQANYRVVGVFAEVLSETMLYLLEHAEEPFIAFDCYQENYDDILCQLQEA